VQASNGSPERCLTPPPAQTQGSINSQPATGKIPDVSRREGDAAGIGFGNRLPGAMPARGDVCGLTSRGAVEGQYATRQILRENQVYNRLQGLPPPALGQQGDAIEQLRLGDRRRK